MNKRLMTGLLAGGMLAAMLPGVASAEPPHYIRVSAGCMDGGPGPQFMDMSRRHPTMGAWKKYLNYMRRTSIPDTGVIDGLCNPGSIKVFSIEKVWPA